MELFKSKFGNVRELTKGGEPWFIAKDVCDILGTKTKDIKKILDSDEVDTIHLSDSKRVSVVINESGLYTLILRSRKKVATEFRKWVTSEVLPCIRKTGKYKIPTEKIKEAKETRIGLTKQWEEHGIKVIIL